MFSVWKFVLHPHARLACKRLSTHHSYHPILSQTETVISKINSVRDRATFHELFANLAVPVNDLYQKSDLQPTLEVELDAANYFLDNSATSLKLSDVVLSDYNDTYARYFYVYELLRATTLLSPTHLSVKVTSDAMNKFALFSGRHVAQEDSDISSSTGKSLNDVNIRRITRSVEAPSTSMPTVTQGTNDLPATNNKKTTKNRRLNELVDTLSFNNPEHMNRCVEYSDTSDVPVPATDMRDPLTVMDTNFSSSSAVAFDDKVNFLVYDSQGISLLSEVHKTSLQDGSHEAIKYQFIAKLMALLLHNTDLSKSLNSDSMSNNESMTGILTDGLQYQVIRASSRYEHSNVSSGVHTPCHTVYEIESSRTLSLFDQHKQLRRDVLAELLSHICSALKINTKCVTVDHMEKALKDSGTTQQKQQQQVKSTTSVMLTGSDLDSKLKQLSESIEGAFEKDVDPVLPIKVQSHDSVTDVFVPETSELFPMRQIGVEGSDVLVEEALVTPIPIDKAPQHATADDVTAFARDAMEVNSVANEDQYVDGSSSSSSNRQVSTSSKGDVTTDRTKSVHRPFRVVVEPPALIPIENSVATVTPDSTAASIKDALNSLEEKGEDEDVEVPVTVKVLEAELTICDAEVRSRDLEMNRLRYLLYKEMLENKHSKGDIAHSLNISKEELDKIIATH